MLQKMRALDKCVLRRELKVLHINTHLRNNISYFVEYVESGSEFLSWNSLISIQNYPAKYPENVTENSYLRHIAIAFFNVFSTIISVHFLF